MPRVSGSGTAVAFLILAAGLAGLESTAGAQSATPPPVREGWSIPLDGAKWEEGNRQRKHWELLVQYLPKGEEPASWSALVTTHVLLANPGEVSIRRIAALTQVQLEHDCPSLEYEILRLEEKELLYEWRNGGCAGRPPQHELSRVAIGRTGVHRLSFAGRTERLDEKRREQWLAAIEAAEIVEPAPNPAFRER